MRLRFCQSLIFISLIMVGCTDEEEFETYTTFFTNKSNVNLIIKGYDSDNDIIYEHALFVDGSTPPCEYSSSTFLGANCRADSIVVIFSNDKGYSCANRPNGNDLCFDNSPLAGSETSDFNEVSPNTFEYEITQENFENAFDLPE